MKKRLILISSLLLEMPLLLSFVAMGTTALGAEIKNKYAYNSCQLALIDHASSHMETTALPLITLPSGKTMTPIVTEESLSHILTGVMVHTLNTTVTPPIKVSMLRKGLHTVAGLEAFLQSRPDVVSLDRLNPLILATAQPQYWYHLIEDRSGIVFARLPDAVMTSDAQNGLEGAERTGDGVYGWKTLFPRNYDGPRLIQGLSEALSSITHLDERNNGMVQLWATIGQGKKRFPVTLIFNAEGHLVTAYPLPNAAQLDKLRSIKHDLAESTWLLESQRLLAPQLDELRPQLKKLIINMGKMGAEATKHQLFEEYETLQRIFASLVDSDQIEAGLRFFTLPAALRQPERFLMPLLLKVGTSVNPNAEGFAFMHQFGVLLEAFDFVYGTKHAAAFYKLFLRSYTNIRNPQFMTERLLFSRYARYVVRSRDPVLVQDFFDVAIEAPLTDAAFSQIEHWNLVDIRELLNIALQQKLDPAFNRKLFRFALRLAKSWKIAFHADLAANRSRLDSMDKNRLSDIFLAGGGARSFHWSAINSESDIVALVDREFADYQEIRAGMLFEILQNTASYLGAVPAPQLAQSLLDIQQDIRQDLDARLNAFKTDFLTRNINLYRRRLAGDLNIFIKARPMYIRPGEDRVPWVQAEGVLKQIPGFQELEPFCQQEVVMAYYHGSSGRVSDYCGHQLISIIQSNIELRNKGVGGYRGTRGRTFFERPLQPWADIDHLYRI